MTSIAPQADTSPVVSASLAADMMIAPPKPVFHVLSILIPVYNEERYLAAVLKRVVDQPLPGELSREIIMVNDASKDKTWDIMQQIPGLFADRMGTTFKILNKTENEG